MPQPPMATPPPATRQTYWHLLRLGLSPDEAANLTAFLSGIPVLEQHWRLAEVNGLLFLRELNRGGHFRSDEAPA